MTIDDFIRVFPLFRKTGRDIVQNMVSAGQSRTIPAQTRIYSEGDACTAIAFVLSGEIRVYKIGETGREITLYEIGPGETCILNASCILSHTSYPAHAIATADVTVLLVPSPVFYRLVKEHEVMQTYVFTLLSQRLVTVMELVEEIAFGRMDRRLMDYLIERSENNRLESTHQRIANDLGTSREVVSRLLKDLEHRKLLKLSRNEIRLLQSE